MLPDVGSPAPDFSLPSTAGNDVTLSELRGQIVLLAFFPLAFTSTCTAEMCAFSDDYRVFETEDAVVLPISVDSVPTLQEYRRKENIAPHLLSDFKRVVCRLYGTLREDRFYSMRAYVLIDRKGIVRWTHAEHVSGARRENRELLEQIRAAA